MKPRDETFDDRARDEFERAYARENLRSQESSAGLLRDVLHLESGRRMSQRLKLNVIVPMTLTGVPESEVGRNSHRLAASTAAPRNSTGPEMDRAEITLPASSVVTSTTTDPLIRPAIASGGYRGSTRFVALP